MKQNENKPVPPIISTYISNMFDKNVNKNIRTNFRDNLQNIQDVVSEAITKFDRDNLMEESLSKNSKRSRIRSAHSYND